MHIFHSHRSILTLISLLTLALFAPQSTIAGEPDTTCFESIPVGFNNTLTNPTYFTIIDEIAYVIDDNARLVIIDLNAFAFFPTLANIELQFSVSSNSTITLADDRSALYITNGSGFHIYEISDLTDPWFVRHYPAPIESETIPAAGGRMFISNEIAYDNTRPLAIRLLEQENTFNFIGNPLKIVDNTLYTSSLATYDMSNPANPIELSTGELLPEINGEAYLIENNHIYSFDGNTLSTFTIVNPSTIIHENDTTIDIAGAPDAFTLKNSILFVAQEGITATDISNPNDPIFLGSYTGSTGIDNVTGLITIDGVIHSINSNNAGQGNLTAFTLTTNPLATFATPGTALEIKVLNEGNTPSGKHLALIADDTAGMQIYDITDPQNAKHIAHYQSLNTAIGIDATPTTAFIATHQAGLDIVDISDPSNPTLIANFDPGSSTQDVQVIGNLAYVVNRTRGLYILDITDPANPTVVSITDTLGHAEDITIHQHNTSGNTQTIALISHGDQDHYIIDVTNILAPTILSTIPPSANPVALTMTISMQNEFIYTADNQAGYRVFDASDISNPFLVTTVNTGLPETKDFAGLPGQPTQIQFGSANTLILANGSAGLSFYNNVEITQPALLSYRLVGNAIGNPTSSIRRFEIHDNLLFTATRGGGFRIYDLYDCQTPCPVDFNHDGQANFFDISIFLQAYNNQDPLADLTGDGKYNFYDVSLLFNIFTQGCP